MRESCLHFGVWVEKLVCFIIPGHTQRSRKNLFVWFLSLGVLAKEELHPWNLNFHLSNLSLRPLSFYQLTFWPEINTPFVLLPP